MHTPVGVDEFGREHFVVEAPRGRLGVALGDNDRGFVVIRAFDTLSPSDLETWEEIDRRRLQLMRQSVQVGDRIVTIDGLNVVHCSLNEVISRLGKLSSVTRRLTFARYHESGFHAGKYDVEKLVLARVPSGPLGLQINECIPYGAFIEGFQLLPDGTMSKLASHGLIHRGCHIINVNGADVSSSPREQVVALLASLKDQEKHVVFYRATDSSCSSIFSVESSVSERHLGFTLDETITVRCVVTSVGPRGDQRIGLGDVLIGVNMTDVTTLHRKDAIALVKDTPLPRQMYFTRHQEVEVPEGHVVHLGAGPLGVNLDGEQRDCARITGFTSPQDAERPEFKYCVRFAPGSFILAIGHLNVSRHDLVSISSMLGKLKHAGKAILLGNAALLKIHRADASHVKVQVAKGPLGVNFNGARPDAAFVAGFYRPSMDGTPGPIEASGLVPVGAALERINGMNLSCLALAGVTDLLKKLSNVSKELVFNISSVHEDLNTCVVDVRLPPGPLGIDLKSSIANKVIVDKMNSDPALGSTRIFDHGGVVEGSEILAIDGFDVATLELGEVLQLLKSLAEHPKVITFSTNRSAFARMNDPSERATLIKVTMPGHMELPVDTRVLDRLELSEQVQASTLVAKRSRLLAIDGVDVRCFSLQQVVAALKSLSESQKLTMVFDSNPVRRRSSPSKPWLAHTVSSVLTTSPPVSPSKKAAGTDNVRASMASANESTSKQVRQSTSTPNLQKFTEVQPPSPSQPLTPTYPSSPDLSIEIPSSPRPSTDIGSPLSPLRVAPPPPVLAALPSLSRLSVRTMEATRSAVHPGKADSEKHQIASTKSEFLINMASWTGSRALYRLTIEEHTRIIHIAPMSKPTSPRLSKSGGVTCIAFADITNIKAGLASSSTRASTNADGSERATVVLTTSAKKSVEFDMRSTDERFAFATRIAQLIPSLQ